MRFFLPLFPNQVQSVAKSFAIRTLHPSITRAKVTKYDKKEGYKYQQIFARHYIVSFQLRRKWVLAQLTTFMNDEYKLQQMYNVHVISILKLITIWHTCILTAMMTDDNSGPRGLFRTSRVNVNVHNLEGTRQSITNSTEGFDTECGPHSRRMKWNC